MVPRGCGARLLGVALEADWTLTVCGSLNQVLESAQLAKDASDDGGAFAVVHRILWVPHAFALDQL